MANEKIGQYAARTALALFGVFAISIRRVSSKYNFMIYVV